ncbi:metallophosphoesterase [Desulfoscipio gibsoniae]|uniref:Phosphoesterase n=1 Tax=Desulfoscipio gibsoniae DSM 7213 TaxID=767817 RepID=R4KG90_9FIRM|nr:metallophosphoesterase [Desulfoscipio gibsoniae]AGL01609.1 phosphoesterase, MJ0936 family [Desulfoscipio gibsoniae DSM 7213]
MLAKQTQHHVLFCGFADKGRGSEIVRVGVISDTHGSFSTAMQAINKMGTIDALIHAGDLYSDALQISSDIKVPVYAVTGNCDITDPGQEELIFTLGDYKIYITHGHLYRVKNTLQLLYYRVQEVEAQVAVFGHTHVPVNTWQNNVLLFNPGSTSRPPPGVKASFGILDIGTDGAKGEIFSL